MIHTWLKLTYDDFNILIWQNDASSRDVLEIKFLGSYEIGNKYKYYHDNSILCTEYRIGIMYVSSFVSTHKPYFL